MPALVTNPIVEYSEEYFFGVSLLVAATLNYVLAFMLLFDSNNYLYDETPRYLRSRRMTGAALAIFATGFLLHWLFMPHFTNLMAGKALSFTYFHIGGVLFSMSHTGLIDRHYLTRRVVWRDVTVLVISLAVYWTNAFIGNLTLTYIGSGLFFVHIGYLTWVFYSRFSRIYHQLSHYADYKPHDTDHEVLWMHYSCHLIIAFGIGGMLCTVIFHDATTPFTVLLFMGILVFSYIYKALDSYGAIVNEAEGNLTESEEYRHADEEHPSVDKEHPSVDVMASDDDVSERVEQWVADGYYTDPKLTLNDTLQQMHISENALYYYIECHTDVRNYRQWLSTLRIEEAKRQMLLNPDYSLQAIAQACGYSAGSSLCRSFKAQEGMTPLEWQKKQTPPENLESPKPRNIE